MAASLAALQDGMNFRPFINSYCLMTMDTGKFKKILNMTDYGNCCNSLEAGHLCHPDTTDGRGDALSSMCTGHPCSSCSLHTWLPSLHITAFNCPPLQEGICKVISSHTFPRLSGQRFCFIHLQPWRSPGCSFDRKCFPFVGYLTTLQIWKDI
jgi:hypothetical protein